ncbi:MAG: hypothetical protein AAF429_14160 [Pseudomonadota bacterium]
MSNTVSIAQQQFHISGAGETIQAVPNLEDVFAPPHHGPRNVPITVELVGDGTCYTHFPIVNTGRYAIYLDSDGAFDGFIYGGQNQSTGTGTPIGSSPTDSGDFAAGFVSDGEIIFANDDPSPIAIKLTGAAGTKLRYIVTAFSD